MRLKILYFLCVLLCIAFASNAQNTILLDYSTQDYTVKDKDVFVFEDVKGNFSIDQIIQNDSVFKPVKDPYAYNVNSKSIYWVKFKVKNLTGKERDFLLETYSPATNDFRFYFPDKNNVYKEKLSGHDYKFEVREHQNKNVIFSLPVSGKDSDEVVFYVRIKSIYYSSFDFRIKSVNYFMHYSTAEYYFLGIYYGILLIMGLYNLILFFTIKEKLYLFYLIYVLCGMLATMTDDGLGFQFLWPDKPFINGIIINRLSPNLLLFSFSLYSISFLQLDEGEMKKYSRFIYILLGVYSIYYLLALLIPVLNEAVRPFYLSIFILIYILAVKVYRSGYKPAFYFLIAYSLIFISIIIIQLRGMNWVPGNIFTVYSLNYGLVFEVVLLSFAQAERLRIAKKEKEEAQEKIIQSLEDNKQLQTKVNRELEQKVQERTSELNKSNHDLTEAYEKMKEMNRVINEMNAKLDKDNWALKKDLKEDLKARIIDEEVSFETFLEVFPDDSACFRYLEDLKWRDGYVCRKCKNNKWNKGNTPFIRKCTRCGNAESVTAFTLFHGVRFPINKAFYMAYIIHRRGDNITLKELSEKIDLRKNTVWSFKKKIIEHIDMYKKRVKGARLENWEEIIL